MTTTLVTALYDIGREKLSGKYAYRSFDKYRSWFKYLLSINVPKIIHIDAKLLSYVQEYNLYPDISTIIIKPFEELEAYVLYHDRIQQTIDNMRNEYQVLPDHYVHCPEFITAKYPVCIFSKFDFLKMASETNPYNSDYFIWLDAGTFYQEPPFDVTLNWPDPYKIRLLQDKFLVPNINFDPKRPIPDKIAYLKTNTNEVCAYMLGGTKLAITTIHRLFWEKVEWALANNVINNEQHILQLMIREDPDRYFLWHNTRGDYPQLTLPLADRMIPYELSLGTKMSYNYLLDPRISLYAVSTIEVAPHTYSRWLKTATYYGFNHKIMCTNETWKGFQVKIQGLYRALQECKTPYVVLTDTSDVYFQGSSSELCDKFIAMKSEIVVGGEQVMYYPIEKHDHDTVNTYFLNIAQGPQCFPNTGFIMGKTEIVKKLFESNLGYNDDQAACIDAIFEGRQIIDIDYRTELIGNVPK